jgi:hypothetical protein
MIGGTVLHWNPRGFCFVRRDDNMGDIFLHAREMMPAGLETDTGVFPQTSRRRVMAIRLPTTDIGGVPSAKPSRKDWRVAYHEAGHAVVAWALGFKIGKVAIGLKGKHPGTADFSGELPKEMALIATEAGAEAERRFAGSLTTRHRSDRAFNKQALAKLNPETRKTVERRVKADAVRFVEYHWPRIEALAGALLSRRRLAGHEVEALLSTRPL